MNQGQILRSLFETSKKLGCVTPVIKQDTIQLFAGQTRQSLQVSNKSMAVIAHDQQWEISVQAINQEL